MFLYWKPFSAWEGFLSFGGGGRMLIVKRQISKCPSRERLFDSLRLGNEGPEVTIHCVREEFVNSSYQGTYDDQLRASAVNYDAFSGQVVDIKRLNDRASMFLVELELTGIGAPSLFRIFAFVNTEERNKCGPLYVVWPAEGEPCPERATERWRFNQDLSRARLEDELLTLTT
jgi:hypothetical protein